MNAVNFNLRFYPLHQHIRERIAAGDLGAVRFVTGHYFQDWLFLDTDWNWRLEPDQGGALRAVGDIGSHWLDLMAYVTGQPVVAVMAELATFVTTRQQPNGPVETFSTERSTDTVARAMGTEDVAAILLRFANGARGSVAVSQISAGRKNSLQWEIDGPADRPRGTRRRPITSGWATASARTRSSCAIRPRWARPAGPPRPFRAATSRASATRSAPCSARSTRTSGPARRARTRRTQPSPQGHDEMLVNDAIARSATRGPLGDVAPMRLGLLTAPFPTTPLLDVARWSAANGFESLEIACWPATGGEARRYAGTSHIDVANAEPGRRRPRSSTRSGATGSRSRASATTRTRSTPIRPTASSSSATCAR